MNRRDFFQRTAAGLAASGLLKRLDAMAAVGGETNDLAIVKGPTVAATVKAAVDGIGGIGAFVKPGNIVLLKPNCSFPNPPSWGSTTHPEVIGAVAGLCFGAGAKRVVVTDFPMSRAAQCFERSGLNELLRSMPALTFVELKEESQFETLPVPGGVEAKELQVAKLIRKADVLINLPTAKTHSATGVSFGLKNLMGLLWNRWPFHQQHDLQTALADLATVVRPHLTLLDAEYALLTNGPQGPGRSEHLRTMIAGRDIVAVDSAGCGLAEWNNRQTTPQNVQHIANAARRGIGTTDLGSLKLLRKELA